MFSNLSSNKGKCFIKAHTMVDIIQRAMLLSNLEMSKGILVIYIFLHQHVISLNLSPTDSKDTRGNFPYSVPIVEVLLYLVKST